MKTILFIHGMGGGSDSRVPRMLRELCPEFHVVARTYPFDPEKALPVIREWIDEVKPDLLMSESMGANYALVLGNGIPRLFLSPALGAPEMIGRFCWLSLIPGIPSMWENIFKPREGDRQKMDFSYHTSRHFRNLSRMVKANTEEGYPADGMFFHALFGRNDFYRKWSVVRIRQWRIHFGAESYSMDNDSHFWNEDRIQNILIPKLKEILAE